MVDSWNHNFIIKSLDGVVEGLLCFPSIKCEIFHGHGNSLLLPSEVMAEAEKATVEYHTSLDFSHTLCLSRTEHLSGPVLVRPTCM